MLYIAILVSSTCTRLISAGLEIQNFSRDSRGYGVQNELKRVISDLCSLPSKESSPPSFFPRWVERFKPRSSFCRVRLANKIAGCLIKSKGTQTSLFEQSKVPISEHPGQNICVIRPYKVYCSPRNGHFFTGRNQLVGMDDSAHLGQCRHRRRVAMDWDTLRCSDLWCMVLSRFPGVKIDDFSAE